MSAKMPHNEIADYAATWGSYVRADDPGAVMYGFDETGRPQSEDHRKAVIEQMNLNLARVTEDPENYDEGEIEEIQSFLLAMEDVPTLEGGDVTFADLKFDFNLAHDGDSWGHAMSWFFDIATELDDRGEDTPHHWQFRRGAGGRGTTWEGLDERYTIARASNEALIQFGNLLCRYTDLLKRKGESY